MGRGKGKEVIYEADGDEECQGAFNLLVANSEVVKMRDNAKEHCLSLLWGQCQRQRDSVGKKRRNWCVNILQ